MSVSNLVAALEVFVEGLIRSTGSDDPNDYHGVVAQREKLIEEFNRFLGVPSVTRQYRSIPDVGPIDVTSEAGAPVAVRGQAAYFLGQRVIVGNEIGTVVVPEQSFTGEPQAPDSVWVFLPSRGYASCYSFINVKPLPNGEL